MSVSSEAEGVVLVVEGGGGCEFQGAVAGCCLGRTGEHACQCDPLEKAVRGMSAGRSVRALTVAERDELAKEVQRTGVVSKEACSELDDRNLAVVLEASWDCRLVE